MAAIATNGTNSQQMRGKPSADAKGGKSFSEELACAQDECPPASQRISTSDLTKCPKSSPRARTTNVTNVERSSVRSKSREDRREVISKQVEVQAISAVTPDKTPEIEPTTIARQTATERVLPYALTTRTVSLQAASSFPKGVDTVARGNDSSIGTARMTPPAAAPEESAARQLSTKPSVPNQVATKSEDHPARLDRNARAKAASPSTDSRPFEGPLASADGAPTEDGVVTTESAVAAAANTSTESERIQITASFEAKNIVSIPRAGSELSSKTTLRTSSTQSKGSDQKSESFGSDAPHMGILGVENLEGGRDKTLAAKAQSPTTVLLTVTSGSLEAPVAACAAFMITLTRTMSSCPGPP